MTILLLHIEKHSKTFSYWTNFSMCLKAGKYRFHFPKGARREKMKKTQNTNCFIHEPILCLIKQVIMKAFLFKCCVTRDFYVVAVCPNSKRTTISFSYLYSNCMVTAYWFVNIYIPYSLVKIPVPTSHKFWPSSTVVSYISITLMFEVQFMVPDDVQCRDPVYMPRFLFFQDKINLNIQKLIFKFLYIYTWNDNFFSSLITRASGFQF